MLEFLQNGLTGASFWQIVIATLVMTHITIIGVTVYLHRAMAHRALDVGPLLSHFFRFWMWLTTGQGTKEWAAIHRKHHAKCETIEDPHSPQALGLKKVFWQGAELYRKEAKNKETLEKYGHGTPDDWIENNLYLPYSAHGVALMLIIDVLLFGTAGLSVWGIQMLWIPVLAAGVINGIGHFWGYRNFDCVDASRNLLPWGILIGGEELHNNHHTFGTSAKLSNKWYEFDIGWMYIQIFEFLGLAKVRKVAPGVRLADKAKTKVDMASVNAVINNRYDVLAKYARSMKQAYKAEMLRLGAELRSVEEKALASMSKKTLVVHESKLSEGELKKLRALCAKSDAMKAMVEMREELRQVWEKTNLSKEQMLELLQKWCERAEASGNRWLQEMSLRVRSYA
ncbi:MAG: fatty acid desaturase [Burkholderiales bacterium]|nr:fatty acid desaturase [Burkholderiales bacterium]